MGQGPSSPRRHYEESGRLGAEHAGNQPPALPPAEPTRQAQQFLTVPAAPLPATITAASSNGPTTAVLAEVVSATSTASRVTSNATGSAAPAVPPASTGSVTQLAANANPASSNPAPAPASSAGGQQATSSSGQQHQRNAVHKSTTLIPGWSRALSSQALQMECQKVHQPLRTASPRDSYAVLELEVMKYVAYCGGVTIKFRVDDLVFGPVDNLTWGLASTRACAALLPPATAPAAAEESSSAVVALAGSGSGSSALVAPGSGASPDPKARNPSGAAGAAPQSSPSKQQASVPVPVDSVSRKPLYMISSASTHRAVSPGDILTIDLAPREDKQPVIMATLKLNDVVLLQSSLPCSIISSLQMFPFVTALPGMSLSLHEAVTPSPLFTWFASGPNSAPETQLCELDTCIKYHTSATTPVHLGPTGCGNSVEFMGSTVFTSGRQRWTVQLDNYGAHPTHIYVGIGASTLETPVSSSSSILANFAGPLRALTSGATNTIANAGPAATPAAAGGGSAAAAAAAAGSAAASIAGATSSAEGAGPSTSAAAVASSEAAAAAAAAAVVRSQQKWGAWVKLPGTVGANNVNPQNPNVPPPLREGSSHIAECTSAHCFITVDLDLNAGYVRFFRNGHLIVSAFTGITGPVSPTVAFVQAPSLNCQAGLVNLTKLRQLDLKWNSDNCSGDLRLNGNSVSKVSEVYGDYSTVLANQGFISGVHLWLVKVNNLSEPDSIFIGVCRGCMPLDQDPQDLRDRTYYLSNGVIRVGGRRVATNAANFTKGDTVGCVLDADQGEIIFFRNGIEQGRARGIRGRLYPFVSCDSEGDQITLLGSYTLLLNRIPRQLADMEWDTLHRGPDIELSSNCLTATKSSSNGPSSVRGTIQYSGTGTHEFHVILDTLGPDGVWVGVAPPGMDPTRCVGDVGCGWALHSDGDKRYAGREQEFTQSFKNGDVLTVSVNLGAGLLRFARNGQPLGVAFEGVRGPLVACVTMGSEESKITIQNRPTVLNTGEYTGELRWDEARAGKDLNVIDGLTVTKMSNEGGDYATVLGTLCLASGQHSWNIYINHVEDSNLFIGVTVGGHDLNADPQEMKHRTYYLSNGTIRVAGKLITRCAEPYAEGDLISVQLDMELRHISFLKNNQLQGAGDGLPEEVWPYVSLDNIMDSITLHSSSMFVDLAHSLRWNPGKASKHALLSADGTTATLRPALNSATGAIEETSGQATVMGLREYNRTEVHSWIVRLEQAPGTPPANFLVGVAPPTMELNRSLGEEHCGIGLDYFGYFYVNGRYFHVTNLSNWSMVAKPVRGSTAKHKGKAAPIFTFNEGKCEVTLTLDLKEGTLKFSHAGRAIGTIAGVKGPLHAAVTITSSRQSAMLAPGPIGKSEHTNEELVNILKAKGCILPSRLEAAMLVIPRDLFVPRDRHREAFRDQKVTVRMSDGSTMTLPPPSFVAMAMEKLNLGPNTAFLDVGCGTAYVTALAACLMGDSGTVHGIECVSSRLEAARSNTKQLRERLTLLERAPGSNGAALATLGTSPSRCVQRVELSLSNVLIPECTDGVTYDALYCDASLSEEDLPTFLSLLKPGGRMVVIIEEEALLVTRSADPHDFEREVITHVSGDFGELEDPTPWEVQEAISRIKERERRKGVEAARSEMSSLRNYEYAEMQQRVNAAMQRIGELETAAMRASGGMSAAAAAGAQAAPGTLSALGSLEPAASASLTLAQQLGSPARMPRSPLRMSGMDDVRIMVRDKSRRTLYAKASPQRVGSDSWEADRGSAYSPGPAQGAGAQASTPAPIPQPSPGGAAAGSGGFRRGKHHGLAAVAQQGADDEYDQATDEYDDDAVADSMAHVSMPQHTFDDIIDSMSTVQTFNVEQVEAMMVGGSGPAMVDGREVFMGTFKGVKVRVWKVPIGHSISYLELRRAYSRYCIAHPNITSVLGVCIQQASGASSTVWSADASAAPSASASRPSTPSCGGPPPPSVGSRTPSGKPITLQVPVPTPGAESDDMDDTDSNAGYMRCGAVSHVLWVVEECFGEETLQSRLERGMLSWQQLMRIALDITKALAFLQDLRQRAVDGVDDAGPAPADQPPPPAVAGVLSAHALRTLVVPTNVQVDAQQTKLSMLPLLLCQLEVPMPAMLGLPAGGGSCAPQAPTPLQCDLSYMDPNMLFAVDSSNAPASFYALGVVLLQLLTEQGALGLLSAVRQARASSTLMNLVPRLVPAANAADMSAWTDAYTALAMRCTQPGGVSSLESEVLPALEELGVKLPQHGSAAALSWEQVEDMLMLPLQPRPTPGPAGPSGSSSNGADTVARRWVRQDFRMRRKMFLQEVAKLATEGPVHKLEIRRSRCFKDSLAIFSGKGHAVWRQPLKVTFIGEAGMDSGGVTREWFSTLSSAISRGSPELFYAAGSQRNQLYVTPTSSSPAHLKKFAFVGLFMAKALIETAARGKELGSILLNLCFAEPFWKLLLGQPLSLMDLQQLDPTEFRSLMSILSMDIDGLIFENFVWTFQHPGGGPNSSSTPVTPPVAALPLPGAESEATTPTASLAAATTLAASPFAANDNDEVAGNAIPLKPGGKHIKVTNHNKREYVLLKAHKMLLGAVEAQMSALIDAFHSVIPRDLLDRYAFSALEMQLLVCGEQRIDVQDLKRYCKYEDGYTGKEDIIAWFWDVAETFDDLQRRQLLQFWSGSDGMPAEGFGALDPAFHMVAVERMYDAADTTARLPAAHTCFRQLDLPRYRSKEELREKILTAITIGQGYMALS